MRDPFFPRRRVLAASIVGSAALTLPTALRGLAAAALAPTPQQTEGPFYPLSYPADSDNDLVHVAGHAEPAKGTMTRVAGRILDPGERPAPGARAEVPRGAAHRRSHDVPGRDGGPRRDEASQGAGA